MKTRWLTGRGGKLLLGGALVSGLVAIGFVACNGDDSSSQGGNDGGSLVFPDGGDGSVTNEGGSGGDGGGGGKDSGPGTDGGASKCSGSAFRLCDGFESGSIDTSLWANTFTSNATVTIDSQHVARGKKALHVHTGVSGSDDAGTNGGVRTSHNFPFPGNQVWGRAFVYMAGQSPDMHTNMIEAVGNLPDAAVSHYRLGVSNGHVLAGNYIPGDYADHSATTMPLDAWKCFEWHFDGQMNEYHVYVDGTEVADMAITSGHTPPWTAPNFAYVEVGLHLYHDLANEPTLDVWYDEVALDTSRVGCGN